MFNKFPKHSGIYYIKDNIDELELQINFRHVHSLLKLPSYEISSKGFKFDENKPNNTNDGGENSSKTTRIKWQQKLFSPQEVEFYNNINNCTTDTHKKYNKLLNSLEDTGRTKSKKRSKKSARSKATKAVALANEIFTYVHEDNFIPDDEETIDNLNPNAKKTVNMYIYAAISPDTELVVLKWCAEQRLLTIYPDFNDMDSNPYFIGIDTDYRHLYAYEVANVSVSRLETKLEPDIIIPELQSLVNWRTHWQGERDLETQFQMPRKRMKRVVLLFEIRAACGFAYQPMHVRYHVHLPENCVLEEGSAEASTHASYASGTNLMCSMTENNMNNCYRYGYNFQLTVLCNENFQASHMLHIYFELISVDNWDRERLEGYTHYSTYLTQAGSEVQELQCLRPTDNLLDYLTCYFFGGIRKFDFVHFFTPSKESAGGLHSRFECRMTNTGHLHVTCQKITQQNCELLSACKNRCHGMTLDDILLAYTQARKRLESLVLE